MNQSYGSKTYDRALDVAIEAITESNVDLVLSTGDMVAGQKPGLDYRGMWDAFHSHVSRPLDRARIPMLPSPGNHDAATGATFERERQEYRSTWRQFPIERFNANRQLDREIRFVPGVRQNFPFHYAVTMGPALIIALDSTVPGRLIDDQFEWLKTVLEQSKDHPVKIVFGHFPLYPFAFQRAHESLSQNSESNGLHRQMESLLETHRVDLYLSGHHHVYYPGHRLGHTRYISVPLLGSGARHLLNADEQKVNRAEQAFLSINIDTQGKVNVQAIRSPGLTPIATESLPPSISIPRRDSAECRGCARYPSAFFLNTFERTLYLRR